MRRGAIHDFSGERGAQAQRPVRQVHKVAAEIRQRAAAERPPVAPFDWHVFRAVRMRGHRAEPQVVMQTRRHRRGIRRRVLATVRRADPDVNFVHWADRARLDQFHHLVIISAGVNLRADLRDELVLAREFRDDAAFRDRARERLLAIDMATTAQRRRRRDRVRVIRRGDDHGVNVPLVEQAPEVVVGFRRREFLFRRGEIRVVHVTQRHDIFAGDIVHVVLGLVRDADDAEVQLLVGGDFSLRGLAAGEPKPGGAEGGLLEELPTVFVLFHNAKLNSATALSD